MYEQSMGDHSLCFEEIPEEIALQDHRPET